VTDRFTTRIEHGPPRDEDARGDERGGRRSPLLCGPTAPKGDAAGHDGIVRRISAALIEAAVVD
jgi:hypothetical protein